MAVPTRIDSCADTTTTTGTGTYTLVGAVPSGAPGTGYTVFVGDAQATNGITVEYRVQSTDGTIWEVNRGVYTVSGSTLTRGTLLKSSTGSAISWSAGTKNVYIVAAGETMAVLDATNSALPATAGGTGQASYATGDIPYASSSTAISKLAIGAATTVLHGGTTPSYSQIVNADITAATINLTTKVTGVLPEANGGTNQSTYAKGDLLHATASNTLGKLAVGATGEVPTVVSGDVAWSSANTLTISSTLIDLGTAGDGYVVNDQTITPTLIAATTKPANPQWTYTIVSGDIPTNTRIATCQLIAQMLFKNNEVALGRTVSWHWTLNGTDLTGSDGTSGSISAGQFQGVAGLFQTNALAVGDVIGLKMWASATNVVDYRGADLYIFGRTFNIPLANEIATFTYGGTNIALQPTGALSGVTYTAGSGLTSVSMGAGLIDPGISSTAPIGTVITAQTIFAALPQYFQGRISTLTDNNSVAGTGVDNKASATLGISPPNTTSTGGLPRYFRTFKIKTPLN